MSKDVTGQEMCELISKYFKARGIDRTWEQIWNYSPTGELAMVYYWYEDALAYFKMDNERKNED